MASALEHGDVGQAATELKDLASHLEGEFGANQRLAALIKELKSASDELESATSEAEREPRPQ
jgi:hypothetical protein